MNLIPLEKRESLARQTIERFVRRFQPSYKRLAYYAALPLLLTPELVNFLRTQFLFGQVPWIAEADLLLSDLCSQVGYELYAMDAAVRSDLLAQMKRQEGETKMQEVARLLIRYLQYLEQTRPSRRPFERQAQKWSAMVYLDDRREQAVREMTQAFQTGIIQPTEMARLARLTKQLAPQLSDYPILLEYAADVSRILVEPKQRQDPQFAAASLYPILSGATLQLKETGFEVKTVDFEVATIVFGEAEPEPEVEKLQSTEVETVTADRQGREIRREQHSVFYFQEFLPGLAKDSIPLRLVAIPSGEFLMGSPENEEGRYNDESPQHPVFVSPFFMSQYPITQAQWRVMAALPQQERKLELNPSRFEGEDRPVEQVSWEDAVEFCQRLSELTGRRYRLPSEAEWEYACRAGTTTPFYFGETLTDKLANYNARKTTPVGSFPPNAFGLYDLHGNVQEWCVDHWHGNYKGAPTDGSAWLDTDKSETHVLRGGSWDLIPRDCRSAFRGSFNPVSRFNVIGFRVVCEARGL